MTQLKVIETMRWKGLKSKNCTSSTYIMNSHTVINLLTGVGEDISKYINVNMYIY